MATPTRLTKQAREYLQRLEELPFVTDARVAAPATADGPPALLLELEDGSHRELALELKTSHLPADADKYLIHRIGSAGADWLVAAPSVSARLGRALENASINFIDRRGNCSLRFGDQYVARVQGRGSKTTEAKMNPLKEMRAAGFQVLFAFLADPSRVGASQRHVAEIAGTSKQPVANLLRRLEAEKRLARKGRRYAWSRKPDGELLERWVAGYRDTLRPNLLAGRFRLQTEDPFATERWLESRLPEVRFGGSAGAYRLVEHSRGSITVAHIGELTDDARVQLRALSAADGPLLWMRTIGSASADGEVPGTVHPLLIYAELMVDPDPRAIEAATLIRERFLPWSL